MIVDFDGLLVTDDTREYKEEAVLLKTYQNAAYIKSERTITPRELIRRLQLEAIDIVGVTGTNGKTTTAAAIYSLLEDLGERAALQGTRGFFVSGEKIEDKTHTTPPLLQTIAHLYEAAKRGVRYFVMEVSSHAIDQNRIENLNFALKVLTNISQDHLDYHKSMERYIATKSSFFIDDTPKLINKEEKRLNFNIKNARTYAIEEMATYKIAAYSLNEGISAVLQHGSQMVDFHSPLMGLFNLYNLTAAIGAVHMLTDTDLEAIAMAVEHFGGVKGRMEIVSYEPLVIVDFAHTPDGMQKVFESFPGGKIVALFGAGGDRDKDKRAKMGAVAARFCQRIYLTSDNPRSEDSTAIIEDIAKGIDSGAHVEKIVDRKEAIRKAIESLEGDEILLILGKGDEAYIEMNGERVPHNDVACAEEYLKEKIR